MNLLEKSVTVVSLAILSPIVSAQSIVLEEIIVTAQKRSEPIQDFAGAISAFGESQIERRGFSQVEDIYQSVPGLNFSDHAGVHLLSIRGIGMQVDTGVAEPGVSTHIDGVFQPRGSMGSMGLVDLGRIEILRGPQGTLYGRNATGGVVNFISRKPSNELEGQFTIGGGDWNMVKANGFVSGPLVDDVLMARLSASYSDHEGYLENLGDGDDEIGDSQQQSIRLALRYVPSDSVVIDFSASYQEEEYHVVQQLLDISVDTSILDVFGINKAPGVIRSDEPHTVFSNAPFPDADKETTRLIANVEWEVSESIQFRSITGYSDHTQGPEIYNADNTSLQTTFIGSVSQPRVQDSESWSQEFNLLGTSIDDRLDWVVGVYYFEEEFDVDLPAVLRDPLASLLGAQGFAPGIRFDQVDQLATEETKSIAFFADATFAISDSLRVNAGLRYTEDDKDIRQRNGSIITNLLPFDLPLATTGVNIAAGSTVRIPSCDGSTTGNNDLSWDATNPKLRLEWDASEDVMLYAQGQEGYKSGGINLSQCDDEFEPEELLSWEAGVKSTVLGGAMTLNAAVYLYQYEDLQVFALDATGTSALVENLSESEIWGGEIELAWQLSDTVSLDSYLAYSDSEITESEPLIDTVALVNNVAIGITDPAAALINPEGNVTPRNPELAAQLGLNVDIPSSKGDFRLRGEVYYQDETQYRIFGNKADIADSYSVVNAFVTYTSPSKIWSIRGYIKNLTDEEYLYQIIHSPTNGKQGNYAPPRHWGLELTVTPF